jgi:pilus assembly protein CpaE
MALKRGVAMPMPIKRTIVASVFRRLKNAWISFLPDQAGVSALEFALFAPVILIGSLSVADLAFLAQQRMSLDQVLRAGAQQAMLDKSASPEAPDVMKVLNVLAAGNFAVGSTNAVNGKPPVVFGASRYCVCPGSVTGPQVSCSTVCPSSKAPLAFYTVSAQSKSSNMILPNISFKPQITVQVR